MNKKNSKVLIVSHNSFSKVLNNGKTLESMFCHFSKDNLAQIFFSQNESPDFEFCDNYFKITDSNVLASLLNGYSDCGAILNRDDQMVIEKSLVDSPKNSKMFEYAKSKAEYLIVFRDVLWSFNSWKSKSLLNWSKNYNPDIIFYIGGNFGFSHKIACFLSKKINVPLVSYFTDDYLIYPNNRNIFDYIQKFRIKRFYSKTIKQSSICFAIGNLMSEEYTNYFKKQFFPIMNSIEVQKYFPYSEKKNITISYFGGLHLNRWKMLIRLANSISDASINVYSIEKPSVEILSKFNNVNIQFKGSVEGDQLKKAILESDILLHVESDDVFNKSLTKLSISTKIPEYLMSGRLVVGFGPEDVASMKILSNNKIGVVISSTLSDDLIKLQFDKILSNFELRRQIGLKGYQYAIDNCDNEIIAKNFKNKLEELKKNNK